LKLLARVEGLQSRKLVAEEEVERQRLKVAEARLHVVEATNTGGEVSDARKRYAEAVLKYELNQLARLEGLRKSGVVAEDEVERQRVKGAQARAVVAQATAEAAAGQ
jgi:multidrug resistance efflux pump